MIDLRSDTVTRPTPAMLNAMMTAKVGDDVFEEDPTINALQQKAAALFGKENALFCPSGTMTNQIAIKVHTQPGDEVICDRLAHIYNYEAGGYAANSGVSIRLIAGDRGRFTAEQVAENINDPDNVHFPISRLVEIENTANKGGGCYYDFSELEKISALTRQKGLKLHLDGARIFNALVETGQTPARHGKLFDSVSFCLSKGLGAPVGSLLLGDSEFIKKARRVRKMWGGGMRQAGYLAAAGIYALDNYSDWLPTDNQRAKTLGKELAQQPYVKNVLPVSTNIIFFDLEDSLPAPGFLQKLKKFDIHALALGKKSIRFVTHLQFTDTMLDKVVDVLRHKI